MVSGHFSLDNCQPGQLLPDHEIPPATIIPQTFSPGQLPLNNPPEQLLPIQLPPMKFPPGQLPLGVLPPVQLLLNIFPLGNYPRAVDPHEIPSRAVDPWIFASEHFL